MLSCVSTETRTPPRFLFILLNGWLSFSALLNFCTMHSPQHPKEHKQRLSGKFTHSHVTEQCLLLTKQFPGQIYDAWSPEWVLRLGPWNLRSEARGAAQSKGFRKQENVTWSLCLHAHQRLLRHFEKLKHIKARKQLVVHAVRFSLFLLIGCCPRPLRE